MDKLTREFVEEMTSVENRICPKCKEKVPLGSILCPYCKYVPPVLGGFILTGEEFMNAVEANFKELKHNG